MHIIADCFEIAVAAAIDDQRLITAAEQMAKFLMPPVVAAGVSAQQPLHSNDQIGLRGFEHQMKVIAHQAIRMDLPAGLFTSLPERFKKALPVLVVIENGVAPVASAHQVIDRAAVLNA